MRNCPACGASIDLETAKFCDKCGEYLFPPHIATPIEGLVEEGHMHVPFPKKWIVTYGMCFDESHDVKEEYREMDYPVACDKLEAELTASLTPALHHVELVGDDRDGECLSVRFSFMIFGPDEFPNMPNVPPFVVLEVLPFHEVYDANNE